MLEGSECTSLIFLETLSTDQGDSDWHQNVELAVYHQCIILPRLKEFFFYNYPDPVACQLQSLDPVRRSAIVSLD